METIFDKIAAHEEETKRLNEELLAERDATQAKIEQLTDYRYELDAVINRMGIRPNMEDDRPVLTPTKDPRIVKRTPRQNAEYVASVPVVRSAPDASMRQLIRDICADGQKRTKAEIFDLVLQQRPDANRQSFETLFSKIGLHSCENDRPNAKRTTRLYWHEATSVN